MPAATERLPIRTVASLTGVSPITLRAWERRHGLVRPERTPKGQRLYTHDQVDLIRRVVALTERGIPISQVRAALGSAPVESKRGDPWQARLERMAGAISRFDEAEVDRIQDEALSIHSIDLVTRRLLLPLLARLGERWESVPGAIAEEHFFAMYMRSKLGARLLHQQRYSTGPRFLAACAPGEHHEIGLLLFCLAAAATGLRPVVLGADMPFAEIAAACRRAACQGVVISGSIDPPEGLLERSLAKLVRETGLPVFVGGGIAMRHRERIARAGAIPVGSDAAEGAELVRARLASGIARQA